MKTYFYFLLTVFLGSISLAQTPIQYEKINNDSFFGGELIARVGSQTFKLISKEDEHCFDIVKIADFDKDGFTDVFIESITGCGGNCCGNSFFTFSWDGNKFISSEMVGYDWNGAEITESNLGYTFVVETVPEGAGNTDICENTTESYRLKNHQLEQINIITEKKVEAVVDFTSKDFENVDSDTLFFKYDLDSDGKMDTITTSYWSRWGSFSSWKIQFGNGASFSSDSSTKRIGVLKTKTNGVYDLVIGCNEILKWDGKGYK